MKLLTHEIARASALILSLILPSSSSSSQPVSMPRWRKHSMSLVFHTLHRGQIDTTLCPYLINYTTLYPLPFPQIWESSILTPFFTLLAHPCSPPPPLLPSPLPLKINNLMFPPPHSYPFPLLPFQCLTEIQKRLCSNVLCDRILPS